MPSVDEDRRAPGATWPKHLVSVVSLFALHRVQRTLQLNPDGVRRRASGPFAWNTAVSFVTRTNWQDYAGENTMSHLTQMAGLAVQNSVSQGVGPSVAMALGGA